MSTTATRGSSSSRSPVYFLPPLDSNTEQPQSHSAPILYMAALLRTFTQAFNSALVSPPSPNPNFFLVSRRGISFKLFVKGLSFYTTDKGLEEAFTQYGQVVEAKVVCDRASDKSKGFGFVTFASEEEAHRAMNKMNGNVLHGRVVSVEIAKPRYKHNLEIPIARGPPDLPNTKD